MDPTGHIEPFGHYAPTAAQRRLIAFARATPLRRGVFRDTVVSLVRTLRPGPLDWRVGEAAFRLHLAGNGTDVGLLLKPRYDAAEIDFLAQGAREAVFVDIGANIGAYALLVAAAVGWRCRVLAIEPLPRLAAQLRINAALNGFGGVAVIEHAVGGSEGELALAVNSGNLGATAVNEHGDCRTRVRPLAAVLADAGVSAVGALKIDVEGYEDRVMVPFFRDAGRGLWPRRIVIEHAKRRAWREDCIADMTRSGYAIVASTRDNTLLALSD